MQELEVKWQIDNIRTNQEGIKQVQGRYFDKSVYIIDEIEKEIDKVENEIVKKWNLEKNLYVTDTDNEISAFLYNKISDKLFYAVDIIELAEEKFSDELKSGIVKYFNKELDTYNKEYDLDNIKEIKEYAEKLLTEGYDKISQKLFNNNVRDNLEKLCNQWDKAYDKQDYDKANEISKKIVKFCNRPIIYKDDILEVRIERILAKNELAQNKIKLGQDGKLSELEEKVLKETLKDPYVGKRSKSLQSNIKKYLGLISREYSMNKKELQELEKLKQKILKQADTNDDFVQGLFYDPQKSCEDLEEILNKLTENK